MKNKTLSLMDISDDLDITSAVFEAKALSVGAGFERSEASMIATATSELATNIRRFASKGSIKIEILDGGIEIVARDRGPGISDISKAMEDHFSTLSGSLGVGLPAVQRLMDEFEIKSTVGRGTVVVCRKWLYGG